MQSVYSLLEGVVGSRNLVRNLSCLVHDWARCGSGLEYERCSVMYVYPFRLMTKLSGSCLEFFTSPTPALKTYHVS